MSSTEIRGRFLPSRVYNRWKWTVRFGLLLVPLLIFLCGGLILFLTPSKYRSSTLIELENGPSSQETLELLKSRGVLQLVSEHLDLTSRLGVDKESTIGFVRDATELKTVPDTRLIKISVTTDRISDSRDLAEEIPRSLRNYLVGVSNQKSAEKAGELDELIRDASDLAEEKAAALANFEKVHGADPNEDSAPPSWQRARRASLLADAEVERLQVLKTNCLTGNIDSLPRLIVHSEPVVSDEPANPKIGPELNELTVRSLVLGLLAALFLPYLMELAFPPRKPRFSEADSMDGL